MCSPYSKHLASLPISDILTYKSQLESPHTCTISIVRLILVSGQDCQCCSLIVYNEHWVKYDEYFKSLLKECIPSIHDPIKHDSLRIFRCLTSYQKTKQADGILSLKTDVNLFSVSTL